MTYHKATYFYVCPECKKTRQTFKEFKAKREKPICGPCKALLPLEGQLNLFGDKPVETVEN